MKSYFIKYIVVFILFSVTIVSCEKDSSPLDSSSVNLIVEDVGVTEAWLRLEIENPKPGYEITVIRDTVTLYHSSVTAPETQLYDQQLLPGKEHTYHAILTVEGQTQTVESHLTTMDTTSHDFTWEMLNFGDGNSSVLRDVFIINSDDIWAVGEIYLKDSTGQTDPQPYGAIHWNGIEWRLMKVPYHDYGTTNKYPGPLRTVFAFDSNNVYVTSSANLLKWDGNSWTEKAFFMTGIPFNGQVKKMWANSENNIYCVGNAGAIYNYNGTNWQRIESGADLDIQDIWGANNEKTSEYEVLCVASNPFEEIGRKILKMENNSIRTLSDSSVTYWLSSVWFLAGQKYYVAGSGIYSKARNLEKNWKRVGQGIAIYYTNSIRGNDRNDIITAGGFGEILHFNGVSWKSYFNTTGLNYGNYYAADINNNLILAVGSEYQQAIIAVGRR